ncbi:hypothetical protein IPA_00865 [Ignicoccus pacificus DSM 13166]|uniref:GIY-YIG nuclease family protein n=1 Tax=Ignicoccus pacificus DSM 13166 TaxID=940294 RepID=A0A977KA84_9CREN|nr:hypothetical protein IPA_00865 [Ignicoccus pacificus DSM 13166]
MSSVEKGAYLLIVEVERGVERWSLKPGLYAYVGSAWGPGGIIARVRRHLTKNFARPRWHIDHLTKSGRPLMAFIYPNLTEDELYQKVSKVLKPAVKGFGSTDTKHYTHLFLVDNLENLMKLWRSVEALKRG